MKVIEDILREVDQEVLRKAPHAQRKYNKITESLRTRFLTKIFQEGKSIKKAAEELNINYSSAKTILTMHRKKEKTTSSSIQLEESSVESPVVKTLPPKNLLVNSFMSTASNLSDLNKDSFEDSQEHSEEIKNTSNNNNNSNNNANSSSFKKSFVQNKSFHFGSHNNSSNNICGLAAPPATPVVHKVNSIIIAPPTKVEETEPKAATLTPAMILQLQQQLQVQQQQQQLQNSLQQLLMMQNSMFTQQNNTSNTQQMNPLVQLLLQQQLLMMNQQQQHNASNNNTTTTTTANWI